MDSKSEAFETTINPLHYCLSEKKSFQGAHIRSSGILFNKSIYSMKRVDLNCLGNTETYGSLAWYTGSLEYSSCYVVQLYL
jgi:hypothetical protein